jgi:hypothetical protein
MADGPQELGSSVGSLRALGRSTTLHGHIIMLLL